MNDKEICSIGITNKEICNKQTYIKSHDIKKVSSLNDVEKDLIISRSGIQFAENAMLNSVLNIDLYILFFAGITLSETHFSQYFSYKMVIFRFS